MISNEKHLISIIIPVHNGKDWIDRCFGSILAQTAIGKVDIEICVCNDASNDGTLNILDKWRESFEKIHINFKIFNNNSGDPKGVGYAKNRAVEISAGEFLCFQDIDDCMMPERISLQYEMAIKLPKYYILGSQFVREPINSTVRYTKWANSLCQDQINEQVFTSHGPTVIMPTWFCHREVFDRVGGFSEKVGGVPEDLIFFYKHLDLDGKVFRVDEVLLIYSYHINATTFSIKEQTIWNIRLERLERTVLINWKHFSIWNAGKQGRKFYNSLSEVNRNKVVAFCDVDKKKIGKTYCSYDSITRKSGTPVKILHFKEACPPFVICVKIDMTDGVFESILASLNMKEGSDYILFS